MTTRILTTTRLAPMEGTLLSRLLARLIAADQSWKSQHKLRELPEHMLKDIGVRRTHFDL